jgi:hypothetical protein
MSEPLVFTFTSAIKEGKPTEYEHALREAIAFIETREPRVIAFETYINDDGSEATTILVHPDAQSEDFHMQVAAQTLQPLYQFADYTKVSIAVYGRPSERVLGQMTELAQSGATLSLKTNYLGGFNRLPAL